MASKEEVMFGLLLVSIGLVVMGALIAYDCLHSRS
jgi:hypothetical protein